MWDPHIQKSGTAIRLVVAAICSAVVAEWLSSRQSELISELLAWLLLPVIVEVFKRVAGSNISWQAPIVGIESSSPTSPCLLWIIAASVTTSSYCRADNNIGGSLSALIPFLLICRDNSQPKYSGSKLSISQIRHPDNSIWRTILPTAIPILTLTDWSMRGIALSLSPGVLLCVLYAAIVYSTPTESHQSNQLVNIDAIADSLSRRVAAILFIALGVQAIVFSSYSYNPTHVLLLALFKGLSWYFLLLLIQHAPWGIVTAIRTFTIISTRDPAIESSGAQALSHAIASLFPLGQTIQIIPKNLKARSGLWVLLLIPLIPYLANIITITAASSGAENFSNLYEHPVEDLVRDAKIDFENLLHKQSKTYAAAREEYQRRYGRPPPPGFEAWYEFAISHQSPIIDDFDIINDALSPFWKLGGKQVQQIMRNVQNVPNNELWSCKISRTAANTECTHPYRSYDRHFGLLFDTLLGSVRGKLPDVEFLVNHLDEPRVLIPPTPNGVLPHSKRPFEFTQLSKQPVWDVVTKYCEAQRSQTDTGFTNIEKAHGLPFVTRPSSAKDLCIHPEHSVMHGLTTSPFSFRLIEGLVPVLTTGSLSTMGDILLPSPAYIEDEFKYDEQHDVDWDKKRNNLYWAGSTTGGFAMDDNWRSFQRQRFVTLAENLEKQQYTYLRESNGAAGRVLSSFLNGRLFDVAFTKIFQCESKHCREQSLYFNTKGWAGKDEALKSRLVFDLDGNGISGRYYKLLASRSTPLKQTLLREWHDERLVPWVHYVPVSQSLEELPELVVYLTSTDRGRRTAREIAEQGREWYYQALREADLSVYVYRLVLELARLQDPGREAS